MKVSYLVTSKNETTTLKNLVDKLLSVVENTIDEIVILNDFTDNEETKQMMK